MTVLHTSQNAHSSLWSSKKPKTFTCKKSLSSCLVALEEMSVDVICLSRSSDSFLRYFSQSSTEGPTSLNMAGGTGEGPCCLGPTAPPSCSASNKTPVAIVTKKTKTLNTPGKQIHTVTHLGKELIIWIMSYIFSFIFIWCFLKIVESSVNHLPSICVRP